MIWTFTFGYGHVLRDGKIQSDGKGGLPLHDYYVVIRADTEQQARVKMTAVFGPGGWAGVYDWSRAPGVVDRGHLRPLLDPSAALALNGGAQ